MMGLFLRQLVAGLSLDVPYRPFNLPLDAALDSLDTGGWHIGVEFQHGHGLLREAVQLLRSEPLEVGEELQLPLGTQAATEGFRDVLEVPSGIQRLLPVSKIGAMRVYSNVSTFLMTPKFW